jgi:hypothetical protein
MHWIHGQTNIPGQSATGHVKAEKLAAQQATDEAAGMRKLFQRLDENIDSLIESYQFSKVRLQIKPPIWIVYL